MANEIENYAIRYGRLHPKVVEAMAPFFKEYKWSPAKAKVRVVSPYWGKLSGRGTPTAVFVVRGNIFVMRGALNAAKPVRSNNWNLATKMGFATLAHEVFHTYQNDRDGFGKFLRSLFSGIWKSLRNSKKLYDHKYFDYELEAIDFEKKVRSTVKLEDIRLFAGMR